MSAKSQVDIWDDEDLPSRRATVHNRDRMKEYGSPVPNMEMFAKLITPIVYPGVDGLEVSPEQAAMILVQLKVMREVQGQYPLDTPDHLEDVSGWTNVLYQCKEARRAAAD